MNQAYLVSDSFEYLEIQWIYMVLSHIDLMNVRYDELEQKLPNILVGEFNRVIIFLISQNEHSSIAKYVSLSSRISRAGKTFGLIHLSDEWFIKADYSKLYDKASFIIRNYYSPFFISPRILQIPLGADPSVGETHEYVINNKVNNSRSSRPFFSGQMKYTRYKMARAFGLTKSKMEKSLKYFEYLDRLSTSSYALCPYGNTTPDTYRLYEALECGCIPLLERSLFVDYFKLFLGREFPVKSFISWDDAVDFVKKLEKNTQIKEEYADEIRIWWVKYKDNLPRLVYEHMNKFAATQGQTLEWLVLIMFRRLLLRMAMLAWLVGLQKLSSLKIRVAGLMKSHLTYQRKVC